MFAGRHMAYDERLAERVRRLLRRRKRPHRRQMFGGPSSRIEIDCVAESSAGSGSAGCGDEFEAVMRREHVRPMDFTGTPLKGFVDVSPPG